MITVFQGEYVRNKRVTNEWTKVIFFASTDEMSGWKISFEGDLRVMSSARILYLRSRLCSAFGFGRSCQTICKVYLSLSPHDRENCAKRT
jgi:hypothetical protein